MRRQAYLSSHVPYTSSGISPTCDKNIKCRMQIDIVDSRHVTMIMSNNLVLLKIPTLNCFVLSAGEEIRLTRTDHNPTNCTDMTRKSKFEMTASKIPNLQRLPCICEVFNQP